MPATQTKLKKDQLSATATDVVLGRATAGAGAIEEIACTPAARTVLDDATVAAMLATLGALPLAGGLMTGEIQLSANCIGGSGYTINTDDAINFTPSRTGGVIIVYITTAVEGAIIIFRTAAVNLATIIAGTANVVVATGVLTNGVPPTGGGTAGKLTVSVDSGTAKIYIKNDLAAQKVVRFLLIGNP